MSELRKAYRYALSDADTAGGILSLANPEGEKLLITRLMLDVTTVATAACTINAGVAAAATTSADDLIDGLDVNAATGVFDNIDDQGSNGQSCLDWGASEYLTISMASGAAAGLAGYAYVEYLRAA